MKSTISGETPGKMLMFRYRQWVYEHEFYHFSKKYFEIFHNKTGKGVSLHLKLVGTSSE